MLIIIFFRIQNIVICNINIIINYFIIRILKKVIHNIQYNDSKPIEVIK